MKNPIEAAKEYKYSGGQCPNCKKDSIISLDTSYDFCSLFEFVKCSECGKRFTFTYRLSEITLEGEI